MAVIIADEAVEREQGYEIIEDVSRSFGKFRPHRLLDKLKSEASPPTESLLTR